MEQNAERGTSIETQATEALQPPSPAGRCHAKLALMRLLAQIDPRAKQCRSLSTEEEIIECMAKRYPTLFIT